MVYSHAAKGAMFVGFGLQALGHRPSQGLLVLGLTRRLNKSTAVWFDRLPDGSPGNTWEFLLTTLTARLGRERARSAVLLMIGPQDPTRETLTEFRSVAAVATQHLGASRIDVIEALVVGPRRFRSVGCDLGCCPVQGHHLDGSPALPEAPPTPTAAQMPTPTPTAPTAPKVPTPRHDGTTSAVTTQGATAATTGAVDPVVTAVLGAPGNPLDEDRDSAAAAVVARDPLAIVQSWREWLSDLHPAQDGLAQLTRREQDVLVVAASCASSPTLEGNVPEFLLLCAADRRLTVTDLARITDARAQACSANAPVASRIDRACALLRRAWAQSPDQDRAGEIVSLLAWLLWYAGDARSLALARHAQTLAPHSVRVEFTAKLVGSGDRAPWQLSRS